MVSCVTSFIPFGIFKITERKDSLLWNRLKASFRKGQAMPTDKEFRVVTAKTDRGSPIRLF